VVRIIAAGETSPLLKAKTANSCYLLHWYIFLVSLVPGADRNTGAPGMGTKTQCALLCQEFGFQHVSLDDILREKSDDQTYLHANFVKDCLDEKVYVPRELKISLLERKINEGIEEGKMLTSGRCKKHITLCFSTAQLRGC